MVEKMDKQMIAHIYDRESNTYDAKYQKQIHLIEDKIVGNIIKPLLKEYRQSVLEIGCGTGHVISLANIDHLNYQGIDISKASVEKARKKYPKHFFTVADITSCEPKRKNDLVLMIYGQINYIGLQESIELLKQFCKSFMHSKFVCIMYCGKGHEDYNYTKTLQKFYKPSEIKKTFKSILGIDINLYGFSFLDVKEDYEIQLNETLKTKMDDGQEMRCKYLILSNVEIFNER